MGERHDREGAGRRKMPHLHEVVIANSRVWLKLQGSCVSCEQAEAFFGLSFHWDGPHRGRTGLRHPFQALRTIRSRCQLGVDCGPAPCGLGRRAIPDWRGRPIRGAKPGRRAATATARKGGWTSSIARTSACMRRRIGGQGSRRTSGTGTMFECWSRSSLAATRPENGRG